MDTLKRRSVDDKYHILEVFECTKDTILYAAQQAGAYVTIENFTHYGRQRATFAFEIQTQTFSLKPGLISFDIDFTLTKTAFEQLMDLWDEQGCYAVFHESEALQFKATTLPEKQRYRALENFGWSLELSVPGAASGDWTQFASPDKKIIDLIEEKVGG